MEIEMGVTIPRDEVIYLYERDTDAIDSGDALALVGTPHSLQVEVYVNGIRWGSGYLAPVEASVNLERPWVLEHELGMVLSPDYQLKVNLRIPGRKVTDKR